MPRERTPVPPEALDIFRKEFGGFDESGCQEDCVLIGDRNIGPFEIVLYATDNSVHPKSTTPQLQAAMETHELYDKLPEEVVELMDKIISVREKMQQLGYTFYINPDHDNRYDPQFSKPVPVLKLRDEIRALVKAFSEEEKQEQ